MSYEIYSHFEVKSHFDYTSCTGSLPSVARISNLDRQLKSKTFKNLARSSAHFFKILDQVLPTTSTVALANSLICTTATDKYCPKIQASTQLADFLEQKLIEGLVDATRAGHRKAHHTNFLLLK